MQYVTGIIMVTFSWVLLYTIFQDQILPLNGGLFALFLLAICSLISGQIVRLLKLPPLLGMLVCGIALFNLGIYRVDGVYKTIDRLRYVVHHIYHNFYVYMYKNFFSCKHLSWIPRCNTVVVGVL